jgi:hypothetical protein
MLSSSFRLGSRQSPGFDPSARPQAPEATWFTSTKAVAKSAGLKQPAFLSQISPVR